MSKHKGRPQLNQLTFVSDSCHVCSFFIISKKTSFFISESGFTFRFAVTALFQLSWIFILLLLYILKLMVSVAVEILSLHTHFCCIYASFNLFLFWIFFFKVFFLHVRGYWDKNSNETAWAHIKNYFNCIMHSISTL